MEGIQIRDKQLLYRSINIVLLTQFSGWLHVYRVGELNRTRAVIMYQTLHTLVAAKPSAANQEWLQGGGGAPTVYRIPICRTTDFKESWFLFYTTARIWNQPPEGSSGIPEVLYDQGAAFKIVAAT